MRLKKQLLTLFTRIKLPKRNIDFMQLIPTLLSLADVLNRNDRIYPYRIMKRLNDKFFQMIKLGRGLGLLDHPLTFLVNLRNASHLFTDLWWQGKTVFGKFVVLPTPKGQILKTLLNNGVKLGFSSRGAGSVILSYGGSPDVVDDDFDLVTYDAVSWPSSFNAWVLYDLNGSRKLMKKLSTYKLMPILTGKLNLKYIDLMYKLLKG